MKYLRTNKVSYVTIIIDVLMLIWCLFVVVLGILGHIKVLATIPYAILLVCIIVITIEAIKDFSPTVVRRTRLINNLLTDIVKYSGTIIDSYFDFKVEPELARGLCNDLNNYSKQIIHRIAHDKELYLLLHKELMWKVDITGLYNKVYLDYSKLDVKELRV